MTTTAAPDALATMADTYRRALSPEERKDGVAARWRMYSEPRPMGCWTVAVLRPGALGGEPKRWVALQYADYRVILATRRAYRTKRSAMIAARYMVCDRWNLRPVS